MKSIHRQCLIVLAALTALPSYSLDLLGAYNMAKTNDPTMLAAQSTAEAARESIPQARAGLLPVMSYTNNRSKNATEQTTETIIGPMTREYDYLAKSEALTIRQPVLRVDRIAALQQASAEVSSAEATLSWETQTMALRVSAAYFDVLLARVQLQSVRAQKRAYESQMKNAERSFKAGEGTRTDIDETRSRFLLAAAQEIEIGSHLRQTELSLAALIGKRFSADDLLNLDETRMTYEAGQGSALELLVEQAEEENPELRALRFNFEAAQAEVNRYRAQHLPTIDLVASKSLSSNETNTSVGSAYKTSSIGVQFNLPIFSGGQVNSAVRQALAAQESIRQKMEAARRQLGVEMAKQFDAYFNGEARVKAYEEARNAARQVLLSTRKGVEAGMRNNPDVLNAEQQLATTEFELTKARIDYSLASLKLKAAQGLLSEPDIVRINRWLAMQ